MSHSKLFFPAILVIFWFAMICIVNPMGNFPLNDDWQYARPVFNLINNGHYLASDNFSPVIVAQVFWGTLFCLPGGFSFNALRLSTLVLSFVGILVFYFILLKVSKNRRISFLCALLLAANPLYIVSANSFMTEVPFITISFISIYFFICAAESDKPKYIIMATVFAVIATLIRQFRIVIPLAYGIVSIFSNKPKLIQWWRYMLPSLIAVVALELTLMWLKHIGSELRPYGGSTLADFLSKPFNIVRSGVFRSCYMLYYAGFFLLPLLLFTTARALKGLSRRGKIGILIVTGLYAWALVMRWDRLPYGNVINEYGIGAQLLRGMNEVIDPDFPHALLVTLKTIGFLGAILLVINFCRAIIEIIKGYRTKDDTTKPWFMQAFIIVFFVGYGVLIFVPDFFFDRYLLPLIPLSAMVVLMGMSENNTLKSYSFVTICSIAVVLGITSSVMTHDYVRWNEARWQAADYLNKQLNISPYKVDGGYEYNGWMIGNPRNDTPKNKHRSNMYVEDDEYVIAVRDLDDYAVIKQVPYQNYFPY